MTFDDTIEIQHPYSFRPHERAAIEKAILQTYGVQVTAWWTAWQAGSSTDMAIDKVVIPRATKSTRKQVAQAILMLMHAQINMHHESRSFETPALVVAGAAEAGEA